MSTPSTRTVSCATSTSPDRWVVKAVPTVRGALVFADPPSRRIATVRVRVEDVSRLDVAALIVGEQILRDVLLPASQPVHFAIAVQQLQPDRVHSIRVHVDLSGDGQITPGDFVSTRHYPVTGEDLAGHEVAVHRV